MKIGFLLSHLSDEFLGKSFIKNANSSLEKNNKTDIVVFVTNQSKPVIFPGFASMNINEAFDYKGSVVATNLDLAAKLLGFPGPKLKYYYLWDLEWWKIDDCSYDKMLEVFNNPKLAIIARTEEDKKLIEQCWNCRVKAVIPDCDVWAFMEVIRKDEN